MYTNLYDFFLWAQTNVSLRNVDRIFFNYKSGCKYAITLILKNTSTVQFKGKKKRVLLTSALHVSIPARKKKITPNFKVIQDGRKYLLSK